MSESIRPARLDDLHLLVRFNAAMAVETEDLVLDPVRLSAGVESVLREPRRGFYRIAERDGVAQGSLLITYEWSDWRNAEFWWIQSVYVEPFARRTGVFSRLYEAVEREARTAGACGLRLYAERDNRSAHRCYEALGMSGGHYLVFERDWSAKCA